MKKTKDKNSLPNQDIRQRHLRRQKKKRARRIILRTFLVCMLIFVCAFTFAFLTPIFNIKNIIVSGNTTVSSDIILAAADIVVGENIFNISTKEIKEKVSGVAYIRNVTVTRRLPDSVVINVSESTLKALIPIAAGYIGMDDRGYVLEVFNQNRAGVPLINGLSLLEFKAGSKILVDDMVKFDIIISIIKELDDLELTQNITGIDIENIYDIKLTYDSRLVGIFGGADRLSYKLLFFKEVCQNQQPQSSTGTVDLTIEGQAFVKP